MKYQKGEPGRIFLARFSDGEDVLGGLEELARKENVRAAAFQLVGGMRGGRFVAGPESEQMPPIPIWREIEESHEVVGFGTIFWHGDNPKIHFHGTFGKRDSVKAGCLRESSTVFLVLEAVVMEIKGVNAVRRTDPVSGMALLQLHGE